MGRRWRVLERGEKEKQRRERVRRSREAIHHPGSPLREIGGLGQTLWPYAKFENFKN